MLLVLGEQTVDLRYDPRSKIELCEEGCSHLTGSELSCQQRAKGFVVAYPISELSHS